MAKSKAQRWQAIHDLAIKQFNAAETAVRDEREQCLEDRRFYSISGAMWEGRLGTQFENKPKIEINKIHLAVIRIINEYRNNRISVDFKARLNADPKISDTCDALFRMDEQDSEAHEAYDNAFEEGAGGGIGAFRLFGNYEDEYDEENDYQRINFEPIYDADSCVFWDVNAKKQNKSDAKHCFVIRSLTKEAFEEQYGEDALAASVSKSIDESEFDWNKDDYIYIAEYYVVEEKSKRVHVWKEITGNELRLSDEEAEERRDDLLVFGAEEIRIKNVKERKIRKYIISGAEVLEDCGYIAGKYIPIIMYYGKRWIVDGIERAMGHVRLSKDSQRLKNMQSSKLAEISALGSVEKPILTPEQIAGHELMWEEDNIANYPYLLINAVTDASGNEQPLGPVAYTRPAQVPPALAALLQITEQDIQDLLGNQQNGEKIEGNISTQTALLIQNRLDMQTYIYLSNFAKTMEWCGTVYLSMAQDIYVEENRVLEGITEHGDSKEVIVAREVHDKETGETYVENDLSNANIKVTVDVGPSSATRKDSTVRTLFEMIRITDDPEIKQILILMAIMNMEGEGIGDVKEFFRKRLVAQGVLDKTDEDIRKEQIAAQKQSNQPPSPQEQYILAEAQRAQSEAQENQADVIYKNAKADKARADAAKTLADIERDKNEQAIDLLDTLGERVNPFGGAR